MGRIKQTYIKRVAEKLLKEYKQEFGTEFQANKAKVQELTDVQSKSIRNKIAGTITRSVQQDLAKAA